MGHMLRYFGTGVGSNLNSQGLGLLEGGPYKGHLTGTSCGTSCAGLLEGGPLLLAGTSCRTFCRGPLQWPGTASRGLEGAESAATSAKEGV
jgi:hypothetical protein